MTFFKYLNLLVLVIFIQCKQTKNDFPSSVLIEGSAPSEDSNRTADPQQPLPPTVDVPDYSQRPPVHSAFGAAKYVIIISLDGMRPDALAKASTPNLDQFRNGAAYSDDAKAVMPSVTLVNHTSMLTGVSVKKHGVIWNDDYPFLGLVRVPTIFELVAMNGYSTAMVVGKKKFRYLNLPDTVDHYILNKGDASQIASDAADLILNKQPTLLFLHMKHVDSVGHRKGWMSKAQIEAAEQIDAGLGLVFDAVKVAGTYFDTSVIISADHGGSMKFHGLNIKSHTRIPWMATGPGIIPGLISKDHKIIQYDTAASAAYFLGLEIPNEWDWDGQPVIDN